MAESVALDDYLGQVRREPLQPIEDDLLGLRDRALAASHTCLLAKRDYRARPGQLTTEPGSGQAPAVTFEDRFSGIAAGYASNRPKYPRELVDALATRVAAVELAWDAGCGSGQLSTLLAERFHRVIATDASSQQIAAATPHPRVDYRVAPAEACGLSDRCVDLCVAAQAVHWFDLDSYYSEVKRVARTGCVVAMITYALPSVDDAVDAVLGELLAVVKPYWPPNRRLVDVLYADLPFPFIEEPFPSVEMTALWPAHRLIGYSSTWSSTLTLTKRRGSSMLAPIHARIRKVWGHGLRTVRWRIGVRIGRV